MPYGYVLLKLESLDFVDFLLDIVDQFITHV